MKTSIHRIIPLGLLAAVAAYFAAGVTRAQIPVLSTKDKVASRVGVFRGGSIFTPDGGGHTGQAGDRAVDFGMGTGPVYVEDATFLNALAQDDEMSVALWVHKYDIANGSGFWMNSPSSNEGTRGFQAHIPWSNNHVFFDTAGCRAAPQRINANVNDWPGWSGDWFTWHFFVFVKNGGDKQIWIDGQYFLIGDNTDPLPTDFTELFIGATASGVNRMSGVIDDFAIFGSALSETTIAQLAGGTAPTALPASDKLTACWTFDDFPAAGVFTCILPVPNTETARPDLVYVRHLDGTVVWDQSQVSLKVDDTPVSFTFAKNGRLSDYGRGSTDTIFSFVVSKAGVYPFRCVWFEGNGDANLEWFTVMPSGEKILINDASNAAAIKAYRARTASPQPTVALSVARSGNDLTITSDPQPLPAGFELQTAPSINGPWTTQAGADTPITVPIGTEQAVFLRAAKP